MPVNCSIKLGFLNILYLIYTDTITRCRYRQVPCG